MSVDENSVPNMKQVIKVRMLPSETQAEALAATLTTCNNAASWLSKALHTERIRGKYAVQSRFYPELKERFGLSAQPAIRVIAKVAAAYNTLRANIDAGNCGPAGSPRRKRVEGRPITFRADSAQPFDARCLSWQIPETIGRDAKVSIWTTQGRMKGIGVIGDPKKLVLLRTRPICQTDLLFRDGKWLLYATIEAPEMPQSAPTNGFVGVDMGIVNIATTSENYRVARGAIEPVPQAPTTPAGTVAGEKNQFVTPTTQKAPPQGGAIRHRTQPPNLQTHRGRGATHRARYRRRTTDGNP
jgi:putative transposase